MSASDRHPNNQDPSLESRFSKAQKQRYRPYTPMSGNVLPGLLYAARSFGITSPADLTVDGVKENRDIFVDALSAMPDRVLLSALDLKRADYDRIALRAALTTAEIKYTEQRHAFLCTMRDQNNGELAVGGATLDILDEVLCMRGLGEPEGNQEYHRNARTAELVALTLAGSHVDQLQDVIGSRWLGEDGRVDEVFSEEDAKEDGDDEVCDDEDNSLPNTLST